VLEILKFLFENYADIFHENTKDRVEH